MEHLWAPWRMDYIQSADAPAGGCVFCRLRDAGDDETNLILARGCTCCVILNKFPYNPGHLLILPLAHKAGLDALTPEETLEFLGTTERMRALLQQVMNPHGYNLGINLGRTAGAGIPDHLHLHLVPRWNGDCNFMPVVGQTKVLPQALEDTYHILRRTLQAGQK